jgi:site-specific recombinase XerD
MNAPNKNQKYPAEVLTSEEVAALIGQCSTKAPTGVRNRAMIWLLYRSGLRVSELVAIRPADVKLSEHSIRLLGTKSGNPQTRGFHPSADDALMRWMDKRREYGFRNGPLFCTLDGGPIHPQYVRNLLKRLADDKHAGLGRRVHPHALRHTYADELRRAGVDVVTISKLLGHSSIAVTARYLDHLSNGQAIATLEAVDLPDL